MSLYTTHTVYIHGCTIHTDKHPYICTYINQELRNVNFMGGVKWKTIGGLHLRHSMNTVFCPPIVSSGVRLGEKMRSFREENLVSHNTAHVGILCGIAPPPPSGEIAGGRRMSCAGLGGKSDGSQIPRKVRVRVRVRVSPNFNHAHTAIAVLIRDQGHPRAVWIGVGMPAAEGTVQVATASTSEWGDGRSRGRGRRVDRGTPAALWCVRYRCRGIPPLKIPSRNCITSIMARPPTKK